MSAVTEYTWQQIQAHGPRIALAVILFAGFWLASAVLRSFCLRLSRHTDSNTGYVLRLSGRIGGIALIVFGAITALGTMGINVSALVAGLGLTGFALGFALKDVLSNLLAGVLILLYRPFEITDWIKVADLEGRVTGIDLRYTTLEGDGKKYLIPNSVLFTHSITLIDRPPQGMRPAATA